MAVLVLSTILAACGGDESGDAAAGDGGGRADGGGGGWEDLDGAGGPDAGGTEGDGGGGAGDGGSEGDSGGGGTGGPWGVTVSGTEGGKFTLTGIRCAEDVVGPNTTIFVQLWKAWNPDNPQASEYPVLAAQIQGETVKVAPGIYSGASGEVQAKGHYQGSATGAQYLAQDLVFIITAYEPGVMFAGEVDFLGSLTAPAGEVTVTPAAFKFNCPCLLEGTGKFKCPGE